jgi:hypothetical protein
VTGTFLFTSFTSEEAALCDEGLISVKSSAGSKKEIKVLLFPSLVNPAVFFSEET